MLLCSLLCVLVSVTFVVEVNGAILADEDPMIVLFDEGHGQFFNRTLYSKAIADLEDLGLRVEFNTEEFNETTFEGVDLLILTDPQEKISFDERIHVRDFLLAENSMLVLANPLTETNDTLDGHSDYLNFVLDAQEFGIVSSFWTDETSAQPKKPTDIVKNDFHNAGKPEYLILDINATNHEILSNHENVSTIVTTSCSIKNSRNEIIIGSTQAYADPPVGDPHTYSTNIVLFALAGTSETFDAKVALGGSTTMFSDLVDPLLATSWYEAGDNAKLWRNVVRWLGDEIEEETIQQPNKELYDPFLLGMSTIAVIFVVGGAAIFMVGSGQEITVLKVKEKVEAKEKKDKDVSSEEKVRKTPAKQTKRDRRLRQIQKHAKSDRRK